MFRREAAKDTLQQVLKNFSVDVLGLIGLIDLLDLLGLLL